MIGVDENEQLDESEWTWLYTSVRASFDVMIHAFVMFPMTFMTSINLSSTKSHFGLTLEMIPS